MNHVQNAEIGRRVPKEIMMPITSIPRYIKTLKKPLTFLLLFLPCGIASANPIIINHSHDFLWISSAYGHIPFWYAALATICALFIEYLALKALSGSQEPKIAKLGRKFLTINSVTFPLTQVIAFWLGPFSEILPIVGEKLFYNRDKRFKSWGYKGWLAILSVNLLSYLVGLLFAAAYLWVHAA